jgi:hypothetical protein
MIAGIIKFYLKPDKHDEGISFWRTSIEEAKDRHPVMKDKLQGYVLLFDRGTGRAYSIGLWNSFKDSRDFHDSDFYREKIAALERFCLKPPIRDQFEVVSGGFEEIFRLAV